MTIDHVTRAGLAQTLEGSTVGQPGRHPRAQCTATGAPLREGSHVSVLCARSPGGKRYRVEGVFAAGPEAPERLRPRETADQVLAEARLAVLEHAHERQLCLVAVDVVAHSPAGEGSGLDAGGIGRVGR